MLLYSEAISYANYADYQVLPANNHVQAEYPMHTLQHPASRIVP